MPQEQLTQPFMFPPTQEDLASDQQGLPHSLEIIREFLDQIHAPEDPFDPNGEWKHSYRIVIALRGAYGSSSHAGALKISRRLSGSELVELDIAQSVTASWYPATSNTTARLTCAADQLATPREWEVRSVHLDADRKPVNYTRISTKDAADGSKGRIGKRFTSNWSLFDAVQRLPFDGKPLTFDLLEDLDKPKLGHRLCYSGSMEVTLGGKPVRLHSFSHLGRGILPYTYWLDDNHRLLMAIGGLVAYLHDPEASLVEESQ